MPDTALMYLDLLKKVLTRTVAPERYIPLRPKNPIKRSVNTALGSLGYELVRVNVYKPEDRDVGLDWPSEAETMIGMKRLDNLQQCVESVVKDDVPGDLIETGVWRGGASILMRACLKAFGDARRTVWVADSFQGLPRPNEAEYPADAGDKHWTYDNLGVSLEDVQANFRKYGLLDEQVRFLKGWFKDTLPQVPVSAFSLLRLDGDMYESTIQALDALYPKLSVGGFCIIDDYKLPGCKSAVDDYRARTHITEQIVPVDWTGVYWRREK